MTKSHGERLLAYLGAPNPSSTLILVLNRLNGRTKIGKAVGAEGFVVDCNQIRWREAEAWVRQRAGELGLRLTPRASGALIEAVLDATTTPARLVFFRDISHLGRGYPLEILGVGTFFGTTY